MTSAAIGQEGADHGRLAVMENLLYIVWTDRNKVDIPILDEQHRGIVSTINSLHYFIRQGRRLDALDSTLVVLRQYTAIHFRTEEALMRESAARQWMSISSCTGS